MKVVFLGATQGMGRALARLMAARGDELFLLGRAPDELVRHATDLRIRGAATPKSDFRFCPPLGVMKTEKSAKSALCNLFHRVFAQ